jgi:hypothetical protein
VQPIQVELLETEKMLVAWRKVKATPDSDALRLRQRVCNMSQDSSPQIAVERAKVCQTKGPGVVTT